MSTTAPTLSHDDRAAIRAAKGLLMRLFGWHEFAAHKALGRASMDSRTPRLVIARRLLAAAPTRDGVKAALRGEGR